MKKGMTLPIDGYALKKDKLKNNRSVLQAGRLFLYMLKD